jgi:hypothetical protein
LDVREETNVETTFLATTGVLMYFFCSVIRLWGHIIYVGHVQSFNELVTINNSFFSISTLILHFSFLFFIIKCSGQWWRATR